MRLFYIFLLLLILNILNALSIEDVYLYLKSTDNGIYSKYENVTYSKPSMNYLPSDWLFQTPNGWGYTIDQLNLSRTHGSLPLDSTWNLPICQNDNDCIQPAVCKEALFSNDKRLLCQTGSYNLLNQFSNLISSANYTVDVIHYDNSNNVDSIFTQALEVSLKKLAQKSIDENKTIYVRFLKGVQIPSGFSVKNFILTLSTLKDFILKITKDLPNGNHLVLSVANMESCYIINNCFKFKNLLFLFSFNHGKLINVDNNILFTGNSNYTDDYLLYNPVIDIDIKIQGPILLYANTFTNIIWNYVSKNKFLSLNQCFTYQNNQITNDCLDNIPFPPISNNNPPNVNTMFVATYGTNVISSDTDQSEMARVYAVYNAKSIVRIVQQAVDIIGYKDFNKVFFPNTTLDYNFPVPNIIAAMAYDITRNVDVYITTSSLTSTSSDTYSSFVSNQYIYNQIFNNIRVLEPNMSDSLIKTLLNSKLHLSTIAFTPNDPKVGITSLHAKFWMVDDQVFYIGSHNIYPTNLQEFGLVLDSSTFATQLIQQWWNPLWDNSTKFVNQ